MKIIWSKRAQLDLGRLYELLADVNINAANRIFDALIAAPDRILDHPYIGEIVDSTFPKEVRRLLVGSYEMRYSVTESTLYILRIWHTREQRY